MAAFPNIYLVFIIYTEGYNDQPQYIAIIHGMYVLRYWIPMRVYTFCNGIESMLKLG